MKKKEVLSMKTGVCIFSLTVAMAAVPLSAETVSVISPDGRNEIRLSTEPELSYSVLRDGKERVAPTPIGMAVVEAPAFGGAGMKIAASESSVREGLVATPLYKKSHIDEKAVLKSVSFDGGWRVDIVARDDGVAYRMASSLPGRIRIAKETGGVGFPANDVVLDAYYVDKGIRNPFRNSWESTNETIRSGEVEVNRLIYLPLVARYADGVAMCVTESDLLDYPGLNLMRGASSPTLVSAMGKCRDKALSDYIAETEGSRTYPWRVFVLAPSAVKLCEADIVNALATPSRIGDESWIRPGMVAWDWWSNLNLTGVKFKTGINTKSYEYFIDFAAKNGVPYVILDGGWSVNDDLFTINPNVDLPRLLECSRRSGVGLILWSSWGKLAGRQREVFSHYASMGVKGFKIDFMDSDDQYMVRFIEETAKAAAECRLVIDYHGMYKPTGLSRTYPNVLNYEGVHGLERMKWRTYSGDFPANDLKSFFVRMTAGPMDYTPGAMRNMTQKDFRTSFATPGSQGTRVHQMALMSLYEAPLQMLCDSPTMYEKNKECFDFMKAVPTTWDDTVGVAGDPLRYAVCARRKGDVWYLSAICSWEAQTLTVDTSFLGKGRWRAEIFSDGANAGRDATDYEHGDKTISAGDKIEMTLAPGGGWTARLVPAPPASAALSADFSEVTGRIRPELHSSGVGPMICSCPAETVEAIRAMGFHAARTHDWALINSNERVCDNHHVFPLEHLDPKDPGSYHFGPTDYLLRRTRDELGAEIFFRLGTSIEHSGPKVHFNTLIPKDFDLVAENFAATVRHYNRGWANGYEWGVRYWEIWNEPDGANTQWCLPDGDLGPDGKGDPAKSKLRREKFAKFFATCAKRLKDEFGDSIKVGGPAMTSLAPHMSVWFKDIFRACRDVGTKPDFISWHYYENDTDILIDSISRGRALCDANGLPDCELIINEWHYLGEYGWKGLRSLDREERRKSLEGPHSHNNIDSSCFNLAVLSRFQWSGLSQAYWYGCKHTGAWGWKEKSQERNKLYHGFCIFSDFLRAGEVMCRGDIDNPKGPPVLTVLASRSADGRRRTLLVTDYRMCMVKIEIDVKGVPAGAKVSAEMHDFAHDRAPAAFDFENGRLTLRKNDSESAAFLVSFTLAE